MCVGGDVTFAKCCAQSSGSNMSRSVTDERTPPPSPGPGKEREERVTERRKDSASVAPPQWEHLKLLTDPGAWRSFCTEAAAYDRAEEIAAALKKLDLSGKDQGGWYTSRSQCTPHLSRPGRRCMTPQRATTSRCASSC